MAENVSDISTKIRQALAVSEPDLDTGVGTPVRKILDAVAEVAAEMGVEKYLLNYQYDIDSKTGTDLDNFVVLFGIQRYSSKRATGVITFNRFTSSTADIFIPAGIQVATSSTPLIVAQTAVPAVLSAGDGSIDVPAQTIIAGAAANVPAFGFNSQITPLDGIQAIVNNNAFTGGSDAETDDALRTRFKRTVFRSIAGTQDMFLGVALEDPDVNRANVVGASKQQREQIGITGGVGTSSAQDVKLAYGTNVFVGNDIDSGDIFPPATYDFDDTVQPPTLTAVDTGLMPDGVYELQYDYVSTASRNDPATDITNRIDVWLAGTRAVQAVETLLFDDTTLFSASSVNKWFHTAFERLDGSSGPTVGNLVIPLSFSPILDVPTHLTIGAETYDLGVDYFIVQQKSPFGYAPRSLVAMEWLSTGNGQSQALPDDGTSFMLTYDYDDIPTSVEIALNQWKLVTTDVWAHRAKQIILDFHIVIIYSDGAVISSVQAEVQANLATFVQSINFDQALQVSDLLRVIGNTPGVDAVRFATHADNGTHYAIQQVDESDTVIQTFDDGGSPARAIDVVFGDDEVPVFNNVTFLRRAQNNFGVV